MEQVFILLHQQIHHEAVCFPLLTTTDSLIQFMATGISSTVETHYSQILKSLNDKTLARSQS
jgi:hypothetical protein